MRVRKGTLRITLETFSDSVFLIKSEAELQFVIKKNDISHGDKHTLQEYWDDYEGSYIEVSKPTARIILWKDPKISVLVHEVSHAVNAIMVDRGIEDDETRAYMCEYITAQCLAKTKKGKIG